MQFDSTVLPYLRGEVFSNGLHIPIAQPETSIPDRLALLDTLLADARVIHVGCCDHVPLIKAKLAQNTWLHARLARVTTSCFGVDTSEEGIRMMRDELGYASVACADITTDTIPEIQSQSWDYLLLGELVEHIDDPISFLRALAIRYRGIVRQVIITVPNALSELNAIHAKRHEEFINTDHRHWFSPFTLAKQLHQAGIEPVSFQFAELYPQPGGLRARLNLTQWRKRRTLSRYPALREGLIMIGRL